MELVRVDARLIEQIPKAIVVLRVALGDDRELLHRPMVAHQPGRPSTSPELGPGRAGSTAQYHLPLAKPPKAISPMSKMMSPIQKLHTIIRMIPTMTRMPPRPMPPVLPPAPRSVAMSLLLSGWSLHGLLAPPALSSPMYPATSRASPGPGPGRRRARDDQRSGA